MIRDNSGKPCIMLMSALRRPRCLTALVLLFASAIISEIVLVGWCREERSFCVFEWKEKEC